MIQVHAIVGLPGVGKSALMRRIIARLGGLELAETFAWELVCGHLFAAQRMMVVGKYDDPAQAFPGTDRLSMAVQPQASQFLRLVQDAEAWDGYTFLFEGDRLTSLVFFQGIAAGGAPLTVWEMCAPESVRESRCRQRGSNQSPEFIQGRATKIRRICKALRPCILNNDSTTNLDDLATRVLEMALARKSVIFPV